MPIALLPDRAVVTVSGEEADSFLQGILTCNVETLEPGEARLGALLSPQGKILFDFIVVETAPEDGGGFLLDVGAPYAADLAKRLGFYKLRAKVGVEDLSQTVAVAAGWDDAARPSEESALVYDDPRLPELGWRAVVEPKVADSDDPSALESYHAHRIAHGVPEGGRDFLFSDAFPHEALMDQLHGVDFDKGCYVGQEVVSRMQHRGSARTRLVPILYLDGFVAEAGAEVTAGDRVLGKTGTGAKGRGLAMLRLDRLQDALAGGEPIRAGGLPARPERAVWTTFAFPEPVAAP